MRIALDLPVPSVREDSLAPVLHPGLPSAAPVRPPTHTDEWTGHAWLQLYGYDDGLLMRDLY
jgi:hypothetical protein